MGRHGVSAYFLATGSLTDEAETADAELLDDDERARRSRFLFARDRRDFTSAHALLRRTLSSRRDLPPTAWRFETARYGKPFLTATQAGSPPLAFSLSHTKGLVACAVGEATELGVDVEAADRRHRDLRRMAERFFSTIETKHLLDLPGPERATRFMEVWVLKESYIKAIGVGLSQPLQSFAFEFVEPGALRFNAPAGHSGAWQFALYAVAERYRLAVAVRRADGAPVAITVKDAAGTADEAVLLRRS